MNRVRSTVRIMVRTAALSARLTRCVAIRLIGHATKPVPTGAGVGRSPESTTSPAAIS